MTTEAPLEYSVHIQAKTGYGSTASNDQLQNSAFFTNQHSSPLTDDDGSMTNLSLISNAATSSDKEESRLRRVAIELSLYVNLFITATKLVAYIRTLSLSVLAALVDSVLDVVSQMVLNYTEKHSSLQRSSAHYPAGASRLEPIGVLTCAALMGMASFEVLKESIESLAYHDSSIAENASLSAFWSMLFVVVVKLLLLALCERAAHERIHGFSPTRQSAIKQAVRVSDPTLEALAQDHWNDALSNAVAAIALLCALKYPTLWFLDPVGAILISIYIIHSWYSTGKEQIEQLTGKSAPEDFIEELYEISSDFDDRMTVDVCRAYHFGPKFLVELEVVLPKDTLLFESHDLGMELQYAIESREEVERCFVHIDYESRPYDEHVVSKGMSECCLFVDFAFIAHWFYNLSHASHLIVPELREKYRPAALRLSSQHSV
jgi:cation diffusion facilitator family transporter